MTITVVTSNLGAGGPKSSGFFGSTPPDYRAALSRQFRTEFLNRLDYAPATARRDTRFTHLVPATAGEHCARPDTGGCTCR